MTRQCGGCTLCCRLLPVRSLGKGANERCKHQRTTKGCAVYSKLFSVAPECALWNCRWLVERAGETRRPDRSHCVIDIMPDYIRAQDDDTGEELNIVVVQVWCDPAHPEAHRDPALRDWLNATKQVALVRFGAVGGAIVLFPPSRAKDGAWMEKVSNIADADRTAADLFRVLPTAV